MRTVLPMTLRAETPTKRAFNEALEECGRCAHPLKAHDESPWCSDCVPDSGNTPDPDHLFVRGCVR